MLSLQDLPVEILQEIFFTLIREERYAPPTQDDLKAIDVSKCQRAIMLWHYMNKSHVYTSWPGRYVGARAMILVSKALNTTIGALFAPGGLLDPIPDPEASLACRFVNFAAHVDFVRLHKPYEMVHCITWTKAPVYQRVIDTLEVTFKLPENPLLYLSVNQVMSEESGVELGFGVLRYSIDGLETVIMHALECGPGASPLNPSFLCIRKLAVNIISPERRYTHPGSLSFNQDLQTAQRVVPTLNHGVPLEDWKGVRFMDMQSDPASLIPYLTSCPSGELLAWRLFTALVQCNPFWGDLVARRTIRGEIEILLDGEQRAVLDVQKIRVPCI